MAMRFIVIVLAALFAGCAQDSPALQDEEPGFGIIRGTVSDGAAAQRLAHAVVTLDGNLSTTTSHSGFFNFLAVPAGTHTLTVQAEGFEDKLLEVQVIGGDGAPRWVIINMWPEGS